MKCPDKADASEMPKLEADDRGTTSRSLKFYYGNKERLGRLIKVEVRSTKITHPNPHFCYLCFEKGIVHFTGLNCGYRGLGPNGLAEILFKEGFFDTLQDALEHVAGHDEIVLPSEKKFVLTDTEYYNKTGIERKPKCPFNFPTCPMPAVEAGENVREECRDCKVFKVRK